MRRILILLPLLILLVGCQSRQIQRERYDQLGVQAATHEDVRKALGDPTHETSLMWIYDRHDQRLTVKLEFDEAGRLIRKEWIEGATGTWEDSSDSTGRSGD